MSYSVKEVKCTIDILENENCILSKYFKVNINE